ncbi:MAG: hypothetical protein EOP04_13620, partial [Proteobacteria bacterium]
MLDKITQIYAILICGGIMSGEKNTKLTLIASIARLAPMLALTACIGTSGLGSSGLRTKTTSKNSLISATDAPLENLVLTNVVPVGSFIPSGNPNGVGLVINVGAALSKQILNGSDPLALIEDNADNVSYMSSPVEIQVPNFKIKISVPLSAFSYKDSSGKLYFKNTVIFHPPSNSIPKGLIETVYVEKIADIAPIIFENPNGDIMIVGGQRNGKASDIIHRITTDANTVSPLAVYLLKAEITPNVIPLTNALVNNWTARNALMTTKVNIAGLINFIVVEHVGEATFRANSVIFTDSGAQAPVFCWNF